MHALVRSGGLLLGGFRGGGEGRYPPWLRLQLALLQLLDVMTQLQCGPQLQAHVLHDHVAAQEHQSFAIDLLWQQRTALSLLKTRKHSGVRVKSGFFFFF